MNWVSRSNIIYILLLNSVFVFLQFSWSRFSRVILETAEFLSIFLPQFTYLLIFSGNVPCPIVYGAVVDSACLIWETICGKQGACRLYDENFFRMFYHGKFTSYLCFKFYNIWKYILVFSTFKNDKY